MLLNGYLEEAVLAVSMKNGNQLADMVRVFNTSITEYQNNQLLAEECKKSRLDPNEALNSFKDHLFGERRLEDELWEDVIAVHLRVVMLVARKASDVAFTEQVAAAQTIQRIFQVSTRWILPVIYAINDDLWKLSLSLSSEQQEECARIINKCVTFCLTDRGPSNQSRKWGAYRTISLLLQIYFHLGQLNLCNNVLRAMGAADLPDPTQYPAGQVVTFRFWLGKYYFVNEEWDKAEGELVLAFAHCHIHSKKNKKLILHYLIPLRLLLRGVIPRVQLVQRYSMDDLFYLDAIDSLNKGDLLTFKSLLNTYERPLLKLGTFLLWERLLFIVYRNLFRKIYLLNGSNTRLSLALLLASFRSLGIKMDDDQISCHLANLISKGMIKGYISQEKSTIVLSQKDPFPNLSAIQ